MNILELQVLEGYIQEEFFILQGILGQEESGVFEAEGLRSIAKLIDNNSFTMLLDDGRQMDIPKDKAILMKKELINLADALDFLNG